MKDDFFEQLRDADPARNAGFDADSTLVRVQTRLNRPPRMSVTPQRALQYLAVAAAFAIFAGGGYVVGAQRDANTLIAAAPNVMSGDVASRELGASGGETAKMSSAGAAWYGNTVLRPADSVPNVAGTAPGYAFDASSLDRVALARAIATALGLDADLVQQQPDGYIGFSASDSVSVDSGTQAQFWANSAARNPWMCMDASTVSPSSDGTAVEPGRSDAKPIQSDCSATWTRPSDADALRAAKQIVDRLQLPAYRDGTLAIGWSDERSVAVVISPRLNGAVLRGVEMSIQVSSEGVYSIGGVGARVVQAETYPIAGARDVALRSALRKWSTFGPWNISQDAGVAVTSGTPDAPKTTIKNGLLMPPAYVLEVDVTSAKRGLQMLWFPGGEVRFLPTWDFVAADGSVWQMLALREDVIDWTAQMPYAVPMAEMQR